MTETTACHQDDSCEPTELEERPIPAGFQMRMAALLIDILLLSAINAALLAIPALLTWRYTTAEPVTMVLGALFFFLFALLSPLLLSFFYYIVLHSFGGQTLGKIFLGIRVVTPEQGSINLGTSFLRWCAHFLSILSFGIGYLWALVDNDKATLHDRIASTRVVQI